jgi:hypothetical protein
MNRTARAAVLLFAVALLAPRAPAAEAKLNPPESLLARALAGPLRDCPGIIFCTRLGYDDGHWYANIGYYCDDQAKKAYSGNGRPDRSGLHRLDLRTGEVATLLDAKGGSVRDPQVHHDAGKLIFALRNAGTDPYHLHEIGVDGAGLRQITTGPFDDYEPVYLPDGDIVFVSTRCDRWVNCWMTQVGILHRSGPNGEGIHAISANTEHDNTPWVLPDGRILYTRWEYVDRSQVEYHHLWAMNPDGTGQSVFYGNLRSWVVMIDAKPVPGSGQVLASFSPGHGANEHTGVATIVDPDRGPDDPAAAHKVQKGGSTRDPYPISRDLFIAARGKEIVLFSTKGESQVLYAHKGPGEVHEPRPIAKRERERVIPVRSRPAMATGTFVLADVYEGRRMEGVRRGEIRKLLVLESLSKPVNFSGGPDLVSWLGTFTLERVLGTVPVEADGSACFEAPAGRQLFFVALDEKDLSVKRMQSFTCVMPGEVQGCSGCHEQRSRAPTARPGARLAALGRPPSRIEPFEGLPDVLDFARDVQPILDRHCVPCHGFERREGRLLLTGDLGPAFSFGYFGIMARKQAADGRNGLGNRPPRTIGSSASPLLAKAAGGHHDVRVSPREWRTLWLWIESGAPFAGTYAALRNAAEQARANEATALAYRGAFEVVGRRCAPCHGKGAKAAEAPQEARPAPPLPLHYDLEGRKAKLARQGQATGAYERILEDDDPYARFAPEILLNFSRPALSPLLLGPLSKGAGGWGICGEVIRDREDPDWKKLLAALERARAAADVAPRFTTASFRPNAQYIRELKRAGILPAAFDAAKDPIDPFKADQEYWRSLWYRPPPAAEGH